MARNAVKDFYGKILGYIDEEPNGDRIARGFTFEILGKYDRANNVTRDFYGKILYQGDHVEALIK